MKIVLFLLVLVPFLFASASPLDMLMKQYNNEDQTHKKTIQKDNGEVIIYSRQDLDHMQAFTLNDVLRTVRLFHLAISFMGKSQLIRSGTKNSSLSKIKIFINSHELNAVTFGNAVAQYGSMNLYFVDHIEIYQAGNSLDNGNDNTGMIIRIYTKDPLRENGTFTQLTVDTLQTLHFNILDAQKIDEEYSYLFNLDLKQDKEKTIHHNGYDFQRDTEKVQLFAQFTKKDNYQIAFSAMRDSAKPFATFSFTPDNQKQVGKNFYVHAQKKITPTILLKASTSAEYLHIDYEDHEGVKFTNGITAKQIHLKLTTKASNLEIQDHIDINDHKFLFGASFDRMEIEPKSFSLNKVAIEEMPKDLEKDIYSIYTQYDSKPYESIKIIGGLKYNYTHMKRHNHYAKIIYRLGAEIEQKNWSTRVLYFNKMIQPSLKQLYFSPLYVHSNSDLKPINNNFINLDFTKQFTSKFNTQIGFTDARLNNMIQVNPKTKTYINTTKEGHLQRFFTRFHYEFNLDNKLTFDYFKMYMKKSFSSSRGFSLKSDNSFNKYTLYNELVFRDSYKDEFSHSIDASYDYTLALTYQYSKKLLLKMKGENLLNKAYTSYIFDRTNKMDGFFIQEHSRKILFSLEYILR